VSDYGIGQCRGLFWTQASAGAVACIALAVALGDAKPSMPVASIAWFFIVAFELARIYQRGRALRTDPSADESGRVVGTGCLRAGRADGLGYRDGSEPGRKRQASWNWCDDARGGAVALP
jgi:hypothetical protein